jgi:hypothetical protein
MTILVKLLVGSAASFLVANKDTVLLLLQFVFQDIPTQKMVVPHLPESN